jgi:thiol-disulfide isomerase/thioredoxin
VFSNVKNYLLTNNFEYFMKKTLLLGFMALAGFTAHAQLPAGSTAPDFTATDINGNVHHLQEYLDQGKTVIIDISATWCGPCWNYHGSHALKNFYNNYGPNGSDEIVVLFIEGDGATTLADLQGTGGNTQGNWTTDPYPIIDSAQIASLYQITYFPTVYRICPNGIVTEIGAQNAVNLKNSVQNGCGQMLTGAQNNAEIEDVTLNLCDASTPIDFNVNFKNYGVNAITSGEIALKENGNAIATASISSNVSTYGAGTVSFSNVTINEGSEYTLELNQVNGGAPFDGPLSAPKTADVTVAQTGNNNSLVVLVQTDNYPGEISWRIKDSNGAVVANGGPYQAGPGAAGAGGPDANTTKTHNVVIPEGVADCFSVELLDSYGDGWSLGSTAHGIEVYSVGTAEPIFDYTAGNFGSNVTLNAAFKTAGILSTDNDLTVSKFAVYPNPSNGVFNFSTQEAVSVTVTDLTGKVVYTAADINNGGSIDLSQLQTGMYIAQVKGQSFEKTEKLVIK